MYRKNKKHSRQRNSSNEADIRISGLDFASEEWNVQDKTLKQAILNVSLDEVHTTGCL
jgi:hypothetical protein